MGRQSKSRAAERRPAGKGRRRQNDRFERRSTRNRVIILVMAALLVLSLVAGALASVFAGRGGVAADGGPSGDVREVAAEDVYDAPFDDVLEPSTSYRAVVATSLGEITIDLDAQGAPLATNNLVNLARDDYYDGVVFHRVIESFMIQVGDPAGTGCGQYDCAAYDPSAPSFPGYTFEDELGPATELVQAQGGYPRGTVAMANAGPDTNGSQFFIVQGELVELPPEYTVFGEVVEGMDVVDAIAGTETDPRDRPVADIVIEDVAIAES